MRQLLKWFLRITLTIIWCIPLHQFLIGLMPTYWKKGDVPGCILYYFERIYLLSIPLAAIIAGIALWLVSKFSIKNIRRLRAIICLCLGISIVFLLVKLYVESTEQLGDLLDDFFSKEHYERLWNMICVRPWNLIQARLIDKPWIWKPTYSQVLNGLITLVSTTLWFIVLLVALVVAILPPFLAFIFLSTISTAFMISFFFAALLNYVSSYAFFYLTKGGIWVLNDLFRTNIHIANEEKFLWEDIVANTFYGIYGFFLGLGLYAATPLFFRLAEKFILTPFAVIFFGKKVRKERPMKEKDAYEDTDYKVVEEKPVHIKQYDIIVPPKLDKIKIRADIKKYSGDKSILGNYFEALAKRFNSRTERKVIEEEIKRLNLEKEWAEALTAQRRAVHQLSRVDTEEEVERRKKEGELGLANLTKDVQQAELEAQLAKFQADKERYQAKAREYREGKKEEKKVEIKERIEQIKNKVISIADAKKKIREEYPSEEAEEIIKELARQLVQEGILSEDY